VETKATHRVNQDVAAVDPLVLRGVGEEGRVLRSEMRQVEAGACGVGRERIPKSDLLSLTGQEVLGLPDVHPEPSEVKRVQLLVGGNGGEDLLFDGSGAQLHESATVSAGRVLSPTSMRSKTLGLNM
jgi:hypothetical protein